MNANLQVGPDGKLRHLLSTEGLSAEMIRRILDTADQFVGVSERDVRFAVDTFMAADRKRLYEDYKHYTDLEKLQERAKSHTQELEGIFAQDAAEQAKAGKEQVAAPSPRLRHAEGVPPARREG